MTKKNGLRGFRPGPTQNRPVQSQQEKKILYYPSGKNNGTYQLCSYCTADLRLCLILFSHDAAHMILYTKYMILYTKLSIYQGFLKSEKLKNLMGPWEAWVHFHQAIFVLNHI